MSTTHHPSRTVPVPAPPQVRCLRHHVWMAACTDCRTARVARAAGPRPGRVAS